MEISAQPQFLAIRRPQRVHSVFDVELRILDSQLGLRLPNQKLGRTKIGDHHRRSCKSRRRYREYLFYAKREDLNL